MLVSKSDLSGKVAIVTGSTQGLGEAIARQMIGCKIAGLIICGRNRELGETLEREFACSASNVHYVSADLSKLSGVEAVVDKAESVFGRIDILVNAAGITDRASIFDTDEDTFDRIFEVNFKAPFFMIQRTAHVMRREKVSGSIVNIQSISAHGGTPFLTAYSASKGALATLTKNVAHSLAYHRIRVNGLNVGWMATPGEDDAMKRFHGARDDWLTNAEKAQPFGRLICVEEIARMCTYLASDQSGLITGANIDFDQRVVGTSMKPLEVD